MHVVGAPGRLGQQCPQVGVAGLGLGPVEVALLAEVSDQPAATRVRVEFVVRDDMADTRFLVVRVGAAERRHVDVFTGDASNDVGTGDEDAALRAP